MTQEITSVELKGLKTLFDKYDKDHSTSLSRSEVRQLVRRIFRQEHKEDFDRKHLDKYSNKTFKEYDIDGSGTLNFEEFVQLYQRIIFDSEFPEKLRKKANFSLNNPELVSDSDKKEYLQNQQKVQVSSISLVGKQKDICPSSLMSDAMIGMYFGKYCNSEGLCGPEEMRKLTYDLGVFLTVEEALLVVGNLGTIFLILFLTGRPANQSQTNKSSKQTSPITQTNSTKKTNPTKQQNQPCKQTQPSKQTLPSKRTNERNPTKHRNPKVKNQQN
eukprot:TRINITY_DN13210_c0_g1_i4.p1 TRINITY_DN13210_c0_g1~~TRINITY_DN13210_c0_g1_i4.p1  ORF type:complete len:273 (+),score=46.85 TRINITY_DN13210_c0_g1_i4:54-872(+)